MTLIPSLGCRTKRPQSQARGLELSVSFVLYSRLFPVLFRFPVHKIPIERLREATTGRLPPWHRWNDSGSRTDFSSCFFVFSLVTAKNQENQRGTAAVFESHGVETQ